MLAPTLVRLPITPGAKPLVVASHTRVDAVDPDVDPTIFRQIGLRPARTSSCRLRLSRLITGADVDVR